MELSIVIPCLNEAETIGIVVEKANRSLRDHKISGEVIVADNGSSDGSIEIARNLGAQVINIPEKGYGAALRGGIAAANGTYVVMGDADDSYDFLKAPSFLVELRKGFDLVMGNRFKGGIAPGAMPVLHRILGNPGLTMISKVLFKTPFNDVYCGLRGFNKQSIQNLNLRMSGMEFALEMVVKASLNKLRLSEIPTTLDVDGRSRPPHLRTWRDGWRSLRFFLLSAPSHLFFVPGILLSLLSLVAMIAIWSGPVTIGALNFDIHTMLYAGAFFLVGAQLLGFWLFASLVSVKEGLRPVTPFIASLAKFRIERGIVAGLLITAVSLGVGIWALESWKAKAFGNLDPFVTMRYVVPSAIAIAFGMQVLFSSFMLAILNINLISQNK